jgi:hypothetical protein
MIGFEPICDDNHKNNVIGQIYKDTLQYDLLVKTIGNGLSLRQTMNVIEDFQNVTGMGTKIGLLAGKITLQVRNYCAESFQIIAEAMRYCWAFAIALDGGNRASAPYLDFLLRFVLGYELFKIHLIAAPMNKSHTVNNMFALTKQIIDVLYPVGQNSTIYGELLSEQNKVNQLALNSIGMFSGQSKALAFTLSNQNIFLS